MIVSVPAERVIAVYNYVRRCCRSRPQRIDQ
jgi:hypothetical protein